MARAIVRLLSPPFRVVRAATAWKASEILRGSEPLLAIIADIRLPDGDGLDVLELARERGEWLPTMCLTAYADDLSYVRRAFRLRVHLLPKPSEAHEILDWLHDVLGLGGDPLVRQRSAVRQFDRQFQIDLDDLLVEVLALALCSRDRQEIAKALGRSLDAVKSRVRRILGSFRRAGLPVGGLAEAVGFIRRPEGALAKKFQAKITRRG